MMANFREVSGKSDKDYRGCQSETKVAQQHSYIDFTLVNKIYTVPNEEIFDMDL